jgi:hypothetical protein
MDPVAVSNTMLSLGYRFGYHANAPLPGWPRSLEQLLEGEAHEPGRKASG